MVALDRRQSVGGWGGGAFPSRSRLAAGGRFNEDDEEDLP